MKKQNIPSWPYFSTQEADAVKNVLLSNKVNYWTGSKCKEFESKFSKFSSTKYAIALANGTVALELALRALDIKKNDEILVTSRTFIASVSSIINMGAKPIFVDVDLDSQNIDHTKLAKSITKKTKGIMCVHLAGWPCNMDEIVKLARKNDLFVIEDCAQAHGAKYKGKPVGSFGDIGCWSFCQDKIMTTGGEGGMVTTNSNKLWKKMWEYKDHGKSYNEMHKKVKANTFRWVHNSFGTNYRMTEMQAAIGLIQLNKMKEWTKTRNRNQQLIWDNCEKIDSLRIPDQSKIDITTTHAAYKCYVFVREEQLKKNWNRDKIINAILKRGWPCQSGSCSEVYLEKAFSKELKPKSRLQNARLLGETSIAFLIHPTLNKVHIYELNLAINEVMKLASK